MTHVTSVDGGGAGLTDSSATSEKCHFDIVQMYKMMFLAHLIESVDMIREMRFRMNKS
jgi:hypothetical protein